MSNKNVSSQSSNFNFFHPILSQIDSKETKTTQKFLKKRTHKEVINNVEENKKLENDLAPKKKTIPPKNKNIKIINVIPDKDNDSLIGDKIIQEESTPDKLIKNKTKKELKVLNSSNIDLNNFMKETLDKEFSKAPRNLNSNIIKTFHGNTSNKSQQNKSNTNNN